MGLISMPAHDPQEPAAKFRLSVHLENMRIWIVNPLSFRYGSGNFQPCVKLEPFSNYLCVKYMWPKLRDGT